jgi:hypothetical protein
MVVFTALSIPNYRGFEASGINEKPILGFPHQHENEAALKNYIASEF